jgi:hypothetical protein
MTQIEKVDDYSISPDGSEIAVAFTPFEHGIGGGIGLYQIKTGSMKIVYPPHYRALLGKWSPDGKKFLFRDDLTVFEYSTLTDSLANFSLQRDSLEIEIVQLAYTSDPNSIVVIAYFSSKKVSEICLYNRSSGAFELRTDDSRDKRDFDFPY